MRISRSAQVAADTPQSGARLLLPSEEILVINGPADGGDNLRMLVNETGQAKLPAVDAFLAPDGNRT